MQNSVLVVAALGLGLPAYAASSGYTTEFVWPTPLQKAVSAGGAPSDPWRKLASSASGSFVYVTATAAGVEKAPEIVNVSTWQHYQPGGRLDLLKKMYYANTREKSNTGLLHAACFEGSPLEIYNDFLRTSVKENEMTGLKGSLRVKTSEDGLMMGVEFQLEGESEGWHFRIPSCDAGKEPIVKSGRGRVQARSASAQRAIAAEPAAKATPKPKGAPKAAAGSGFEAASDTDEAFVINDTPDVPASKQGLKLPSFALKHDYSSAPNESAGSMPWHAMDLTTQDGALKFSLAMQKYAYEGMGDQNPSQPDFNFVAQNSKRYWCNMPWQNQGPSGRESLHGITNERALLPSAIFRDAGSGSDWGVGYYNSVGCKTVGQVFSNPDNPDWSKSKFEEGTAVFKILFTTASFPSDKGAMDWNANVSPPLSNHRQVADVYHIQMDILVRDCSLKGVDPQNNCWVMTTYYYDSSYTNALGLALVPGLTHMRPMGVQVGFEKPGPAGTLAADSSLIFSGSQTNGLEGRLNGPADNPKGSCLSCHSTAGTKMPMVPGPMDEETWTSNEAGNLDFSQQMALAERNVQTKPGN